MQSNDDGRAISKVIVSAVFSNRTMLETLFSPEEKLTSFVLRDGSSTELIPNWREGTENLVPIRPDNNLLRHRAVLLPSEVGEFRDTEQLIAEILAYIKSYVALSDEELKVVTAFVLLSWVYDGFNELPYLRFRGDYGTGKSRALTVVGSICYKPFFASGASTVAPIFHVLDLFQGTLVLDEADFRFSDEKSELVKILNNGNTRGFPVLRMQANARKEFDPRAFRVFGPKVVGMRSCYEDRALESRFLTIEMTRGASMAGVPINLPDKQVDEALALRNKLLMYRLRHRNAVAVNPALAGAKLEARTNQIVLPLLSVATPELRTAIMNLAQTTHQSTLADRAEAPEGRVLGAVAKLSCGRDAPIRLAEIVSWLSEQDAGLGQPITTRLLGKTLRQLGIELYKRNGVCAIAPGQAGRLSHLLEWYGIASRPEQED